MFRVLIVFFLLAGTAWAEENWQFKYEQLAKKHVQLLTEHQQSTALAAKLSLQLIVLQNRDRKNEAAVLAAELKRVEEVKKEKAKESEQ